MLKATNMTAKKHKLQKWIQSELIYAALDEISAASINGFSLTDDESVKAVGKDLIADFIRLNMKSGLIDVKSRLVINSLLEQFRHPRIPVLQRLHG